MVTVETFHSEIRAGPGLDEQCHCCSAPLLCIVTMCFVMSGIIGSDTTQYVTTRINCRFQLFFKLDIITCPAQYVWGGISHFYSWERFFILQHCFCSSTCLCEKLLHQQTKPWIQVLLLNFITSPFTTWVFRSNQIEKTPLLSLGF